MPENSKKTVSFAKIPHGKHLSLAILTYNRNWNHRQCRSTHHYDLILLVLGLITSPSYIHCSGDGQADPDGCLAGQTRN